MQTAIRMTQPPALKTKSYVYGVQPVDGNAAWQLFVAAATGDLDKARKLIAGDRHLVNAQFCYRFPLHLAVFGGHTDLVRLLLANGANPGESIYTYDSWNKLLAAAQDRGFAPIAKLLQRAMQKRFQYDPAFDSLKDAIIARDVRRLNALLRKRPDLALASDALGNNALHWSVITRQLDLLKRFVELGSPLHAERADGQTPVLLAVNGATDYWHRETRGRAHPTLRNTAVIVGALLALGAEYSISVAASVGDQERVEQWLQKDPGLASQLDSARISPLSYAASAGHLHLVKLLLDQGADPNRPEDAAPQGRALYEACVRNDMPIAELLLKQGANPNAGTDSCECCLTIGAVYHGEQAKPLAKLLRAHGAYTPPYRLSLAEFKQAIRDDAKVVRHDEFWNSVQGKRDLQLLELYLDWYDGDLAELPIGPTPTVAVLRRLLERGFDPNQTDWLGRALLHDCAANGERKLAKLLLDAGADKDAVEVEFQETPLGWARRHQQASMIELLT